MAIHFCTMHCGAEYPETTAVPLDSSVTLFGFDVALFDPQGLADWGCYQIWERAKDVERFLSAGGLVFCFLRPMVSTADDGYQWTNYDFLPEGVRRFLHNNLISGSGSFVESSPNPGPMRAYVGRLRGKLRYEARFESLHGHTFAVIRGRQASAGMWTRYGAGAIVFLPIPAYGTPAEEVIDAVLECSTELLQREVGTEPPAWVENYRLPGLEELADAISEVNAKMEELNRRKQELEDERSALEVLCALLYEKGRRLERAVCEGLKTLGVEAELNQERTYDIKAEIEGKTVLVEVEGKDKSPVGIEKVNALFGYVADFASTTGSEPDGLLVANAFRMQEPAKRPNGFSDHVMSSHVYPRSAC